MPLIPRSPTFYASVGLAILAFAAPAHAEMVDPASVDPISHVDTTPKPTSTPEVVPDPPYHRDNLWSHSRISAGVGIRFGSFTINGDSSGTAIPFHLDLGLRRARWFLYGSYDLIGVKAHVASGSPGVEIATPRGTALADLGDGSGLVHRVGANARYVIGRIGESDGGFEAWAEGGLGVQHFRWDAGGTWTRPDLALGIGGTMLGLGHHAHGGFSIGLRIMLAPRNDTANAPPACGGPCDTATPPSSLDRSFLFDMTVPFGT
jgi:hypothetical protein